MRDIKPESNGIDSLAVARSSLGRIVAKNDKVLEEIGKIKSTYK